MDAGDHPIRLRAFLLCLMLSWFSVNCPAAEQPPLSAERLLEAKGSLTLRDVTLAQALFTISETWRINLLFGDNVKGHVNGVFRDASLREVLDSVLLANGYGYRPKGQSLIVMTLEQLGDSNAMLQTRSVPLAAPGADEMVEAAQLMLSPQGKLQRMSSLGSVMIRDYPENVSRIENLFRSTAGRTFHSDDGSTVAPETVRILNPQPANLTSTVRSIAYLSPRHTTATTLVEPMQSFLSDAARVVAIASENRLVVVGNANEIALARRFFDELDRPREQVRITALIYDVNTEELERLGVNWTHNAKAGLDSTGAARQIFGGKFGPFPDPSSGAFAIGDAALDVAAASTGTIGAARLTTLNRYFDLDTIINALDSTDGARLLADPSVTVLDREEASIKIVTEIPIQQLTQTSEGGSIGTTSFREAGVTLTVTPQVGGDGTITMAVTPTFSVLTGFSEGQPIIDSREASTKVRVADGQTLVLGGLRQRSETEKVSGIPGLMRWKRLGKLFRDHSTTIQESELIVFLRPEITTPTSLGTPRQAAAMCVAQAGLDATNWPSQMPIVPDCKDPYCPYHNPRPRFINPQQTMPGHSLITPPGIEPQASVRREFLRPNVLHSNGTGGRMPSAISNGGHGPVDDVSLQPDGTLPAGRAYDVLPPDDRDRKGSLKPDSRFDSDSARPLVPLQGDDATQTSRSNLFGNSSGSRGGRILPVNYEPWTSFAPSQSPAASVRENADSRLQWPSWYQPISESLFRSER